MTEPVPTTESLPIDPTFPPAAYERVARLLRAGVLGFVLLAGAGTIVQLVADPSETVATLLASGPTGGFGTFHLFLTHLASGGSDALILLGIYVMVAVTIGRVGLAAADFYRGGERELGAISLAVIALLLVALFVVAPFVG